MTREIEGTIAGPVEKVATIYDVARVAGVSHQSVSRYMRGLDMRPTTTAKIQKALETVHYRPNLTARALISGRATRIGALTHEVGQVGPSRIIQGATTAARAAGYLLDVVTLDVGDVAELTEGLQLLTRHELAGIVAFASTDSTRAVFERMDLRVPVVIAAEAETTGLPADPVHRGIEELVDHLVALGHRRFLHIAGPATWSAARNRLRAVDGVLSRHGLPAARVAHGDWSARSGHDSVMGLEDDDIPTAIVAANDQMALGAMHALGRRGLTVPADVSVSGVDDTPEAAYFSPALTTIRLDFANQGRAALQALLARIDSDIAVPPWDAPVATLVVRESTGPARTRVSTTST